MAAVAFLSSTTQRVRDHAYQVIGPNNSLRRRSNAPEQSQGQGSGEARSQGHKDFRYEKTYGYSPGLTRSGSRPAIIFF